MVWKRWNWLDNGLLPLLLAVMRACWLWPWLGLARRWLSASYPEPLLPPAVLVGLPLVSLGLTRWLLSRSTPMTNKTIARERLVMATSGLLVLLLVLWWQFYRPEYPLWETTWLTTLGVTLTHWGLELPAPLLSLLAGVYLWLQGMLDGRKTLGHDNIWGTFIIGVGALACYLWIASIGSSGLPSGSVGLVLLFFAVGMAALAVANLKTANGWGLLSNPSAGDQARLQANRYWALSILTTIAGLLVIGLVLGWLIAPQDVARLLSLGNVVLSLIGRLLMGIVLVISYVFFLLFYVVYKLLAPLFTWLSGMLAMEQETNMPEPQSTPEPLQLEPESINSVPEPFRWIGLAIFVLGVLVVFALALRRLQAREPEEEEESRESVYTDNLLQDQLAALWQSWMQRLSSLTVAVRSPFLSLEGELDTRRTIRAVYQNLLAQAGGLGLSRQRDQTPLEYQQHLTEQLAGTDDPMATITRGYVTARYASEPPDSEEAEGVIRAWESLHATLTAQEVEAQQKKRANTDSANEGAEERKVEDPDEYGQP